MDTIFAPWRMEYLMSAKAQACIFCEALARSEDAESLIVHRRPPVFTILNRYPYANGHVMVAPEAHEARLTESPAATLSALIREVALAQDVLTAMYRPGGFNVGANFGRAGGAGVEDHYHFHVVPRWEGDVNFMTVTAAARVIPEELSQTRSAMRAQFSSLGSR
jgi:ATP adenylyltransferase